MLLSTLCLALSLSLTHWRSWFRDCDVDALAEVHGTHFRSGLVREHNASLDAPGSDAPWSAEAAAAVSRGAEWAAARRIFSPLVATPRRVGRGHVGVGAQFGEPRAGYWEYLRVTLRAWRQRANAGLIILTDQAALVRNRARRLTAGAAADAGRDAGAAASTTERTEGLIVQPVNVSEMRESWGIAKTLHGTASSGRTHTVLAAARALMGCRGLAHSPSFSSALPQHPPTPSHCLQAPTRSGTVTCCSPRSCASAASVLGACSCSTSRTC